MSGIASFPRHPPALVVRGGRKRCAARQGVLACCRPVRVPCRNCSFIVRERASHGRILGAVAELRRCGVARRQYRLRVRELGVRHYLPASSHECPGTFSPHCCVMAPYTPSVFRTFFPASLVQERERAATPMGGGPRGFPQWWPRRGAGPPPRPLRPVRERRRPGRAVFRVPGPQGEPPADGPALSPKVGRQHVRPT